MFVLVYGIFVADGEFLVQRNNWRIFGFCRFCVLFLFVDKRTDVFVDVAELVGRFG